MIVIILDRYINPDFCFEFLTFTNKTNIDETYEIKIY